MLREIGRILVLAGAAMVVLGGILWTLGRAGYHGLPGDIRYQSERMHVYVPIATCLLLSLVLTVGFWLRQQFNRP